jgi:hypothetical protein
MPEVDLTFVANNQEFIKSVTDANAAQQKFFDTYDKGTEGFKQNSNEMSAQFENMTRSNQEQTNKFKKSAEEQVGYIEDITNAIKEWEAARNKSTDIKEIERYNQKISEGKKDLQNYYSAGVKGANDMDKATKKSESTFQKMRGTFLKVAGAAAAAYGIIKGGEKIINSAQAAADKWEAAMGGASNALKFLGKSIATLDFSNFFENFANAFKVGKEYIEMLDDLEDRNRALEVQEADARRYILERMHILRDATKENNERIKAADEIIAKEDELMVKRTKNAEIAYNAELKKAIQSSGLSKEELENYIRNYDQIKENIKVGEDYNKMISDRKKLNLVMYNYEVGQAQEKLNKQIQNTTEDTKQWGKIASGVGKLTTEELNKIVETYVSQKEAENSALENTKRIASRRASLLEENIRDEKKIIKKSNSDELKDHKQFLAAIEELNKRAREVELEGLTGKAKIDAEEKFALEELDNQYNNLNKLGKITTEQTAIFEKIRTGIKKNAAAERAKIDSEEVKKAAEASTNTIKLMIEQADSELEMLSGTEAEKLQMQIDSYQKIYDQINQQGNFESFLVAENLQKIIRVIKKELKEVKEKEDFSLWSILGIDPNTEEGKQQVDGIKQASAIMIDSAKKVLDAEMEIAEKRTQIHQDRIDDLEGTLKEEERLQKDGLANNVNLVKKELQAEKTARDKALAEQKKIQQAQKALDTAEQISSLVTASANIFKSLSKGGWTTVLAFGLVAAMLAAFTAAKMKASQAAQMADGGLVTTAGKKYKITRGKRHSEGGEDLNSHVEIESGEGVGVFSRKATAFYGNALPEIVSDINKMNFPKFNIRPEVKANQTFNLRTGIINNKLDSIDKGISVLNQNILNQSHDSNTNGIRIEKKGNKTRIIHVKN